MDIKKFLIKVEYYAEGPTKCTEEKYFYDRERKTGKVPITLEFDYKPWSALKKLTTETHIENGQIIKQDFDFPRTLNIS